MVDEPTSAPSGSALQPYDLIRLVAGNRFGIGTDVLLTVVDTVGTTPGVYEVHHQTDHPGYMDWAGAVTLEDVATVVRPTNDGTALSWDPRP